jgi:hypothetical protein
VSWYGTSSGLVWLCPLYEAMAIKEVMESGMQHFSFIVDCK